jgi:hypothetical protein
VQIIAHANTPAEACDVIVAEVRRRIAQIQDQQAGQATVRGSRDCASRISELITLANFLADITWEPKP